MEGAPKARVSSFSLLLLLSALALVLPSSSHSADPLRIDALAPMEVVAEGFQEPMGVIGAAGGAILVSDRKAGRVFSVTAEDKQPLVSGLKRPVGLSLDAEGRLLIVEEATGRLLRLEPGGALTVVARGMTKPRWLAVAADGTFYLSARGIKSESDAVRKDDDLRTDNDDEAQGEVILRISPMGEVSVWVEGFKGLEDLLIHGATVFAAAGGRKHESDDHGAIFQIPVLADGSAGPVGRLTQDVIKKPVGLALDELGALYVSAEEINSKPKDKAAIAKVGSGGALTRFAAKLEKPRGMALDSGGNLYVADGEGTAHGRLLRFRAPSPLAVTAPAFTNQSPLTLTGTTEARSRIDAFVNDTPEIGRAHV